MWGAWGAWSVAIGVDGARSQRSPQRVAVRLGTQRRVDLERGVSRSTRLVGEGEVLGGDLHGDPQALGLGGGDHRRGTCRRRVQHVQTPAGKPGQGDVATDGDVLRLAGPALDPQRRGDRALVQMAAFDQRRTFAVLAEHRASQLHRALERGTHQRRVGHLVAVVGEDAHPRFVQGFEVRQALPGAADGDAAGGMDVAKPYLLAPAAHCGDGLHRVLGGVGVGHGHDGGEPAQRCGPRAALDGLGLFAAGLAQMDMQVDQTGGDPAAPAVDLGAAHHRLGHDPSVGHVHVGAAHTCLVDHRATTEAEVHRRKLLTGQGGGASLAFRCDRP